MTKEDEAFKQQLNAETGRIAWPELQRHFARGVVVLVGPDLDLVEVAVQFVKDDKAAIEGLLNSGQITRAGDRHAKKWVEANSVFWAVVAAPWVLIQEIKE
jgi:hypothetical protein